MANPSIEYYNYLNNIQYYLINIKDLALDLTLESSQLKSTIKEVYNNKNIDLIGVSNSNQGGNIDSRKSTTKNIFLLNNNKDNPSNNLVVISQLSKL